MKPNLFITQVLGLLAFIPAFIMLEFNHKPVNAPEKKEPVKIAKTVTPAPADREGLVIINEGLPHGIIFLHY